MCGHLYVHAHTLYLQRGEERLYLKWLYDMHNYFHYNNCSCMVIIIVPYTSIKCFKLIPQDPEYIGTCENGEVIKYHIFNGSGHVQTIFQNNTEFCSNVECTYPIGQSPEMLSIVAENSVGNSDEGICSTSMSIVVDVAITVYCIILFAAVQYIQ